MTIQEYKTSEKLTLTALADLLGVKRSTLISWYYGTRRPSLERAQQVADRTDGAVGLADWFADD